MDGRVYRLAPVFETDLFEGEILKWQKRKKKKTRGIGKGKEEVPGPL